MDVNGQTGTRWTAMAIAAMQLGAKHIFLVSELFQEDFSNLRQSEDQIWSGASCTKQEIGRKDGSKNEV